MISIQQAFSILDAFPVSLREINLPLLQARGHVLARKIHSPIDMPPFRQATMDGYALALHDTLSYTVIGEIKAGDDNGIELKPGEAVKIFTGAAVPDSAQSVMQIEKVDVNRNQLLLHHPIESGFNIRVKGAQIKSNDVALEKGLLLNVAGIGFLAGIGCTSVWVYQKPTVAIVVTGNELTPPGETLARGKVYESNGIMLQAALHDSAFDSATIYHVKDDFESTKTVLQNAIEAHDLILVSGGISVGDYDFVSRALGDLGLNELFYKVNQKPGKPLYAGNFEGKLVFALPGNPAAGLTCFYVYVRPMLQRLSGLLPVFGRMSHKTLAHDFEVNNARDLILKAKIAANEVWILPHQDSAMLDSFALANALVYLESGDYRCTKGDTVQVFEI